MVHDQHVFTHGMYLPFCFLCPAQSLLCVYPVWVHSQCGLEVLIYIFQLFRCRKLALNRVFSYFLVVGMCLYLGRGWLHTPMFVHPPVCLYAPIHLYAPICLYAPQECTHPPGAPHASVLLHGFGTLHVVGGCFSVLCVLGHTTPIWGCLPLNYTPHTLLLVLCALLFSGISVLMWVFPLLLKGLGVFPHHLGRLG